MVIAHLPNSARSTVVFEDGYRGATHPLALRAFEYCTTAASLWRYAGHQSQVRDDAVFSDDQSGVVEPVCACCGRLQDRESQTPVNKAAKRDEFYRLLGQLHDSAFDARCSARACINPTISEPP
jgi:hypothetical protein